MDPQANLKQLTNSSEDTKPSLRIGALVIVIITFSMIVVGMHYENENCIYGEFKKYTLHGLFIKIFFKFIFLPKY